MKKRLVPPRYIKKAYTKEDNTREEDKEIVDPLENVDKLPEEMFHILGELISFIENINKIEGDKK